MPGVGSSENGLRIRCDCIQMREYLKQNQKLNELKEQLMIAQQREDFQGKRAEKMFVEGGVGKRFLTATFENFERQRMPKAYDIALGFAEKFDENNGEGLLFTGDVGTGKTHLAACIANALIDEGYKVLMTNFASLTNKIQGMFEGKQEFINDLNRYSLLILDDLGAERKSEFMQEMVFNIIDSRYRSGLPFIITTNLTMDEIKKPQEIGYSRIYDRILERCFPVEVAGGSRRRQNVRDTYFDMKEKLGL